MSNFEKLSIGNNEVLKGSMSSELILNLQKEIEAEFSSAYEISKESDTEIFLFRTPNNLETPGVGPGYQFTPKETDTMVVFRTHLVESILQAKNEMYRINEYWALLQTNEDWIQNPVHQHLTADIVAVVYVSVNDGDSIEFRDADGFSENYVPSEGDLLIFKGDAYHKPNKNTGTKHRISLNLELGLIG
jgi:hypothetical protein